MRITHALRCTTVIATSAAGVAFWATNLFASQASLDAYRADTRVRAADKAKAQLLTQAVASTLGIVNQVATTNPPGTATLRDGTLGYGAHNLLPYSGDMGQWSAAASPTGIATGSPIVLPNGQQVATKQWAAAGTSTGFYKGGIPVFASGTQFTIVTYVRRVSGSRTLVCGTDSGGYTACIFDPATGTFSQGPASKGVVACGDAWLVWVTYTSTGSGATPVIYSSVVGSGTTVFETACAYQLGAAVLGYVPTTSAAVYAPRISYDKGATKNFQANSGDCTKTGWVGGNMSTSVANGRNRFTSLSATFAYGLAITSSPAAGQWTAIVDLYAGTGITSINLSLYDGTGGGVATVLSGPGTSSGGENVAGLSQTTPTTVMFTRTVGAGFAGLYFYPSPNSPAAGNYFEIANLRIYPGTGIFAYLQTFSTAPLYSAGSPRTQNLVANASTLAPGGAYAYASGYTLLSASSPDPAGGNNAVRIDWSAVSPSNGVCGGAVTGTVVGCVVTLGYWVRAVSGSGNVDICDAQTTEAKTTVAVTTTWTYARHRKVMAGVGPMPWIQKRADSPAQVEIYLPHLYEGSADLPLANVPLTTGAAYSEYPQLELVREVGRTNLALWNRDLTNAAWTASSVTVAKNATGIDGVASSASTLTASGANGTVLQAITSTSAARITSAWVRRKTGTGTVNMTQDNGTTWTVVYPQPYWSRLEIPSATAANPTIGFRLVTSGDAIEVDYVQHELGAFVTSPMATTTASVARSDDLDAGLASMIAAAGPETIMVELSAAKASGGATQTLVAAGSSGIAVGIDSTGHAMLYDGTNTIATAAALSDNVPAKIATRWGASAAAVCLNGGTIATGSFDGSMGAGAAVGIGDNNAGALGLTGGIRRIAIATKAASDTDLQLAASGGR